MLGCGRRKIKSPNPREFARCHQIWPSLILGRNARQAAEMRNCRRASLEPAWGVQNSVTCSATKRLEKTCKPHIGARDAAGSSGRSNEVRRRREATDQHTQGETTELRWIRVLGTIPPPVQGRDQSQNVDVQRKGCEFISGTSCWHPTRRLNRSGIRRHRQVLGGSLQRPPAGSGQQSQLKARIQLNGRSQHRCQSPFLASMHDDPKGIRIGLRSVDGALQKIPILVETLESWIWGGALLVSETTDVIIRWIYCDPTMHWWTWGATCYDCFKTKCGCGVPENADDHASHMWEGSDGTVTGPLERRSASWNSAWRVSAKVCACRGHWFLLYRWCLLEKWMWANETRYQLEAEPGTAVKHSRVLLPSTTRKAKLRVVREVCGELQGLLLGARPNINPTESHMLEEFITELQDTFATKCDDYQLSDSLYQWIDTGDVHTIRQRPSVLPLAKQVGVVEMLKDKKEYGVIRRLTVFGFRPAFLSRRSKLNLSSLWTVRSWMMLLRKTVSLLPRIDDTLDTLA
jgi:hypothetical protein